MNDIIVLNTKAAYEVADDFAQASAEILCFRMNNRNKLTKDQVLNLEMCEDHLDKIVVSFRNVGIQLIANQYSNDVNKIKSAIVKAKDTIAMVNDIKSAIIISNALVDLAIAVLTARDPSDVATVIKIIDNLTK